MSEFWGYTYADIYAFVLILLLSIASLICAWLFVRNY